MAERDKIIYGGLRVWVAYFGVFSDQDSFARSWTVVAVSQCLLSYQCVQKIPADPIYFWQGIRQKLLKDTVLQSTNERF